MADREKDIRLFQRAAGQRLNTAAFLLEHGFHLEAMYLAGYAVECALKTLILRRTPRNKHASMLKKLTGVGSKGHDFEYLKGLLRQQFRSPRKSERVALGEVVRALGVVASWSTDLRYQVGQMEYDEADRFFRAAKTIRDWSIRS